MRLPNGGTPCLPLPAASLSSVDTMRQRDMKAENTDISTGGASNSWPAEGIGAAGSATSWIGDRWSYKSLLALHLGISVAAPGIGEWMGRKVRTSPVIYVDFNGSVDSFCHRAVAVAEGLGLDPRSPGVRS